MSRAKNAVANGNPNRYSDNRNNLDPFRPLPLRIEKEKVVGDTVTAAPVSRIPIILIVDELGARTVSSIPKAVLRNRDMFQISEEQGVLMLIKQGTISSVVIPDVITEELHPLEVVQRKSDSGYYDPRSHYHKRTSHLNAGHVVRSMDRRMVRAAFEI